ncbi:hypothetical protein GGI12_003992 [Dipsacomyces acuminosporus]|nr:hypothetical protein GGI12_003992 [Dipsacomyces acuminosporus]
MTKPSFHRIASSLLFWLAIVSLICSSVASPPKGSADNSNGTPQKETSAKRGDSDSKESQDKEVIRGVNIGGVFLIEPFIKPSLFDQFLRRNMTDMPVDEWTFTRVLGKDEAKRQLEEHWDTFVTKDHLETLAKYGINWIRIPIGYWAFNLTSEEPFVDGQLPYVERILGWARDIGLKVELDLHGAPGSQNGYDNSGRRGSPEWLYSRTNVDRTLDSLEKMTNLAMAWSDVVYAIQILNEPSQWKWPTKSILEFYNEAYALVRGIAPDILFMIHDTFLPANNWTSLISRNWTNALMDTHIYQMFDNYMVTLNETAHIKMVAEMAQNVTIFNKNDMGVVVGEFSAATHDCTKYINGLGRGTRWEGTLEGQHGPLCPFPKCSCTGDYGSNIDEFSDHYKAFLRRYIGAQLEIYDRQLSGWFYWNFRAEGAPEWDYLVGVEQGWIPKFPRSTMQRPKPYVPDESGKSAATGVFSRLSVSSISAVAAVAILAILI